MNDIVEKNDDGKGKSDATTVGIQLNFGDQLDAITILAQNLLFNQGELAQLANDAFLSAIGSVESEGKENITINYPIGYNHGNGPIQGTRTYKNDELLSSYKFLSNVQLPVNGLYQMSTIMELWLSEIIRTVVQKYPKKISIKKQIPLQTVLSASSLDEIKMRAAESLLHDMTYKSPKDFAAEAAKIISVNLLECPYFHTYIEMKAARDLLIHNDGIVNDTYLGKVGSHAN